MDQKTEFVREYRRGLYTMTGMAECSDISRKTGDALVHRVEEFGMAGLAPQSRRPHSSPNRTPDHIAALLISAKRKHPAWGPAMLLHWRRPRHRTITDVPNELWTADFKGQFRTQDYIYLLSAHNHTADTLKHYATAALRQPDPTPHPAATRDTPPSPASPRVAPRLRVRTQA